MTQFSPFKITLQDRPLDIPIQMRPLNRMAMICISLDKCCRPTGGTLKQLSFINSLYINENLLKSYMAYKKEVTSYEILSPAKDPFFERALRYTLSYSFIEKKNTAKKEIRYRLTQEGKEFVSALEKETILQSIFSISRDIKKVSITDIDLFLRRGV